MITSDELKTIVSFKELDESAITLAASRSADIRLTAGEWLIREGERACFFAVISGALEVSKRVGGLSTVMTTFRTGDTFGEVPLMLGATSLASIRATEPTRLAALDATEFWRLMQTRENFAKAVTADMSARITALWSTAMDVPPARCTIVGSAHSPDCHRLRDFLTRLHIPFDWEEHDAPECDVTFADGRRFISATLRELARALELRTCPRAHCYDVAIIGAGPAGLAAAVYGASEGLRTVLVEREAPGGQAGMSSRIENYLGFPDGISGEDLADRAYRQVARFGADVIVTREATRLEGELYDRRVILDGEETIHCRSVVLATGVSYRYLAAPGCEKFLNRGVYYGAAQAQAREVAGRRIHLLGGGNSAGQAAMFFSPYAEHVSIVIRGGNLSNSMSLYLIDEVSTRRNVSLITDSEVIAVEGKSEVESLLLRNVLDGTERRESTSALFVFIGADARTAWLGDSIATDAEGYVLTGLSDAGLRPNWPLSREPFLLETNQPGIFAVGDVRKSSVKRVASGVGEGATAITMVHQILEEMPPHLRRVSGDATSEIMK